MSRAVNQHVRPRRAPAPVRRTTPPIPGGAYAAANLERIDSCERLGKMLDEAVVQRDRATSRIAAAMWHQAVCEVGERIFQVLRRAVR